MYNNLLKPLSLLFLSLFLVTACEPEGGDLAPNNPGNPPSPKDEDEGQKPKPPKTPTLDKIKQLHAALQAPALKGQFHTLWQDVCAKWWPQEEELEGSRSDSASVLEDHSANFFQRMYTKWYGQEAKSDGSISGYASAEEGDDSAAEVLGVFTQLSPAVDQLANRPASDFDTEAKATQALEALTKGEASTPLSLLTIKKAAEKLQKLAQVDTSDTTKVLENIYVYVSQADVQNHVSGGKDYAGGGNGSVYDPDEQGADQITLGQAQLLCKFAEVLIALAS